MFEHPQAGCGAACPAHSPFRAHAPESCYLPKGPPPACLTSRPCPGRREVEIKPLRKNKDSDMSASSASAGSRFRPSGPRPWEAQNEVPGTPAPDSRPKPLTCCKRRSGPNPGGGRSPGVRVFGDAQAPRLHGEQHMMVHDQGGRQCGRAQAGGMAADGKAAAA